MTEVSVSAPHKDLLGVESGGIRHLVWDVGYGFKIHDAQRNGIVVLVATVVLAVITWVCILR